MSALFILASACLMFGGSVLAEEVEVKYWGIVDLRAYDCEDTASSFVHRVCYDTDELHLVVMLRDTYYAYCRVDQETVDSWLNTVSKGRFYNQNIRDDAVDGRFSCRE